MPWSKWIVTGLLWTAFTATSTATPELTAPLFHKNRYLMGTVFEVAVYEQSSGRAAQAMEEALQEVARLDDVMSNYKSESELSRLNRTAHFRAQAVSPDLYRVIEESLRYSRLSGGKVRCDGWSARRPMESRPGRRTCSVFGRAE